MIRFVSSQKRKSRKNAHFPSQMCTFAGDNSERSLAIQNNVPQSTPLISKSLPIYPAINGNTLFLNKIVRKQKNVSDSEKSPPPLKKSPRALKSNTAGFEKNTAGFFKKVADLSNPHCVIRSICINILLFQKHFSGTFSQMFRIFLKH